MRGIFGRDCQGTKLAFVLFSVLPYHVEFIDVTGRKTVANLADLSLQESVNELAILHRFRQGQQLCKGVSPTNLRGHASLR